MNEISEEVFGELAMRKTNIQETGRERVTYI